MFSYLLGFLVNFIIIYFVQGIQKAFAAKVGENETTAKQQKKIEDKTHRQSIWVRLLYVIDAVCFLL